MLPDMGLTAESDEDDAGRESWRKKLTTGWIGQEQEEGLVQVCCQQELVQKQ